MADKYCDHGAYGAYAATPTWGAAQDGDGSASGVGTPSIAEVVFTGVPSSGLIYVLGVSVVVSWATSADNCANLLATAINASASTAVSPASITRKSQIRNHLYARGPAGGAPSGTCQIMTRQASAAHDGSIAITHTLNNVSSAATINFTGGTGGCWGYLVNGNNATIWASALGQNTYGVWGSQLPFCGNAAAGDAVNVRAKTVTIDNNGGAVSIPFAAMGTASNPVRFVVDDGTIWAGTDPVLWVRCGGAGYQLSIGTLASAGSTTYCVIEGRVYSSGVYSCKITCTSVYSTAISSISGFTFVGCEFAADGGTCATYVSAVYQGVAPDLLVGVRFLYCKFWLQSVSHQLVAPAQYGKIKAVFEGCVIQCIGSIATPHGGFLYSHNGGYAYDVVFRGCRFANFTSGSKLFASAATNFGHVGYEAVLVQNCDLGGVSDFGPTLSSTAVNNTQAAARLRFVALTSSNSTRDYYYESQHGATRWMGLRYPPYCYARLLDGTGWAVEVIPTTQSAMIAVLDPLKTFQIAKINSLADGARTFTVQVAIDDRLSYTKKDVALIVQYVDTTGVLNRVSSWASGGGALTAGTGTWSVEAAGKVTFGANSSSHDKYELSVSTLAGKNLKSGTQVDCHLEFYSSVTNTSYVILVDPEVVIA